MLSDEEDEAIRAAVRACARRERRKPAELRIVKLWPLCLPDVAVPAGAAEVTAMLHTFDNVKPRRLILPRVAGVQLAQLRIGTRSLVTVCGGAGGVPLAQQIRWDLEDAPTVTPGIGAVFEFRNPSQHARYVRGVVLWCEKSSRRVQGSLW